MRNNKKIVWLIVLFLVLSTVVFTIAGKESKNNIKEIGMYFLSRDGAGFELVMKELSAENNEELYKKIAEALIKGPSGKKYMPIIGKEVSLNSVHYKSGSLTVDFSSEYKDSSLISTYAVIKTFTRLPEIRDVKVTAGGMEILKANGEPLGFVSSDEINTESDDDCATGLRLYFANSKKNALVMEYRKINITDTQPTEQYIITELIKGPKGKEHERLLEQSTGVLSVETTDGTCYVNFKQDFIDKNIASKDMSRLIIYSIVNSLTERDNVKNVQFLIEGKKTEKFGDINISELFERNETLIEK